ncbi:hypothetical protein [Streptomyces sp. NPDC002067]
MDIIGADTAYWLTTDRLAAQEKGSALVNALRRLDIEFDDIEIREPCGGCRRTDHKIALGTITPDEADEFALKINRALDRLDRYERTPEDERLPG